MRKLTIGILVAFFSTNVAMAQEAAHVEAMPRWSFLAIGLCGFATMAFVVIAIVGVYVTTSRRPTSSQEMTQMREEIARLREDVEGLKKGVDKPKSTDIRAL